MKKVISLSVLSLTLLSTSAFSKSANKKVDQLKEAASTTGSTIMLNHMTQAAPLLAGLSPEVQAKFLESSTSVAVSLTKEQQVLTLMLAHMNQMSDSLKGLSAEDQAKFLELSANAAIEIAKIIK